MFDEVYPVIQASSLAMIPFLLIAMSRLLEDLASWLIQIREDYLKGEK